MRKGEFVAVMGPSGCGKSTFLNIVGMLDSPSAGEYWFDGQNIAGYSESALSELRKNAIGFVFQSFNLIDELNVAENVELALLYHSDVPAGERKKARRRGAGADEDRPPRPPHAVAAVRRPAAARRRRPRRGGHGPS